jgi:hypothetical protein
MIDGFVLEWFAMCFTLFCHQNILDAVKCHVLHLFEERWVGFDELLEVVATESGTGRLEI